MEPIKPGDDITAKFLNWLRESAAHYHQNKARGEGGEPVRDLINNCTVNVRNNTGGDLRRGEVMELNGGLLSEQDPRYLPFAGAIPNLERVGWGLTLQQIPSGDIDEVLLLGVCIAFVVITDEDHQYADRVDGSVVLQSAAVGPVKILQKPTGSLPSERECVVQLADYSGDFVDCVQVYHSDKAAYEPVNANSFGVHPGKLQRPIEEAMTELGDCWILFVDQYDDLAGDVWAINTDYYGPGRHCGFYDVDSDVRPLIVLLSQSRNAGFNCWSANYL